MSVENSRLQWMRLIQHLQKVSRLVLTGDYGKLADYIAEAVNDLTGASVALWMMDQKEDVLRIRAGRGLHKRHMKNAITPVEPGSSITSIALQEGRPVFRRDILDETEQPRFYNVKEARRRGWRSFLSVPLLGQARQPLGALSVYYRELRDFSESEQDLLSTFANQAAIAFENVRTIQRLNAQLQSLHRVSEARELREVLRLIVESLSTIFLEASVTIRLYDSKTGEFGPRVATGGLTDRLVHDPRPKGASWHVVKTTKSPLYVEDISVKLPNGQPAVRKELIEVGVKAVAYLPLLGEEGVIGLLYVAKLAPYRFSQYDKQILELFANQAAIAVENARLFQELDERSRRLVRLQEVTATISTETSDLEKVLHLIVDSLSEIFWKAPCAIRPYDSATATFGDRVSTGGLTDQLVFTPRPDGASWHIVNTTIPLYVENPSVTLPNGQPAIREELVEKGVRAIAYLPLLSKGDMIGILYVNLTEPYRFSEDDRQILKLFADQAAIAYENAQLYAQLRALFSAMRDVILVYDRQGRYLDVVPTSPPELLYKPAAEMIGKTVHEVLPGPEADLCLGAIHRSLDGGETVSIEYSLNIEGTEFWFEARVSPISRDTVIFVARDITARRQEFAALQDINEAVVSKERDEILQLIVDKAVEVMPGEYSELWLKEAATGDLVLQAVAGPESAKETALRIRRLKAGEASTNMRVARTGEPYIWEGEEEDPDFRRIYRAAQSAVIVPLRYQDEVIGTLNVESAQPEAFTDRHSRLLGSFSDGAASAIENAQVVQELQVLTKIGRTASTLGIDQLLNLVYEEMGNVMDLSDAQVQIAFYDEAKDEVSFPLAMEKEEGKTIDVVRWGKREADYMRRGEDEVVEQFTPRAQRKTPGLNEYVIRTREPLLIPKDFEQDAAERGIKVWPTFGRLDRPTHSWLGVPMMVGGRVIGVISIQSLEQEHAFDEGQQELLTTVASQAAVAIENARLYGYLTQKVEEVEQANRDLEAAHKQAQSAQASLRAMAGGYVHRLNGALGFIPASIDAVIDGLSADIQDVLRDVKGGVVDALEFTKRMTDLVVSQELPRESVDINLILRAVVHRFKIPSTKVGVTWEFAPDLPEIMADKMFLTEVFNNMVLNALEAMEDKPEGELRIGGRLVDTEVVEIWLSDTGCGIPEENLPKIFEPEFTTKPGKRGLGLWFCDTVIKAHGGRIHVDSTPEKGTTFTLALPVGGQ